MWSISEKVPWGVEKKQKDGSCFHIHSINLCLVIGELRPLIVRKVFFNDFVDYVFCAFELVFFFFFYTYYSKMVKSKDTRVQKANVSTQIAFEPIANLFGCLIRLHILVYNFRRRLLVYQKPDWIWTL
ncbi:hypothetical protein STEG23_019143 [Scotinomys teguina]